jgi:hypothetical protein
MNKIVLIIALGGLVSLTGCKKEAGSGGTSAITGHVDGREYASGGGGNAESEVTQITIPNGSAITDGDYILLNSPNGGTLYYLWFKWTNGAQSGPNLSGRTGIQVDYDFSESNAQVAANALTALNTGAGADFSVSLNNDILTLTNTATGEVADAEEWSSNLSVDIQNQGQSAIAGGSSFTEGAIADERVYLVYGEEGYYSESVRTDASGDYRFDGLNRGDYTIFAFSTDTLTGLTTQVEVATTISDKKSIVSATDLFIVK